MALVPKKITDLTVATALGGNEAVPLVQGATKRVTLSTLASFVKSTMEGTALNLAVGLNSPFTIPAGYAIFMMYVKLNSDGTLGVLNSNTLDPYVEDIEFAAGVTTSFSTTIMAITDTQITFDASAEGTIRIHLHKI